MWRVSEDCKELEIHSHQSIDFDTKIRVLDKKELKELKENLKSYELSEKLKDIGYNASQDKKSWAPEEV